MLSRLTTLNLKARIAFTVLLLFLGGIWLLTFLATTRLKEDFSEVLANQQFSYVSQTSLAIEGQIQAHFKALSTIGKEITPAMLADPAKLHTLLSQRPLLLSYFSTGVAVISKEGIGLADYPPLGQRTGASFAEFEFFQEVIATGQPALGKARLGRFSKQLGVTMAVPILDEKQRTIGVLAGLAALHDNALFGSILNAQFGKSGWIAISDARYRIIVAINDPKRLLQPFPETGVNVMLDKFAAGYEGSGISINSRGREVLTSAKKIGQTGWFVQAVLPSEEAFQPIQEMVSRIYQIAAILSLVVALVIWLLIKRLLKPLSAASTDIRRMAMGEYELAELPVSRQDEIGELLKTFNLLFKQRSEMENVLRENESRLRTIIANEPECIKIVDAEGKLVLMNPAGLAMVEADTPEEVIGQQVIDVIAPEYRDAFNAMHQRVIAGEAVQLEFEVLGLKGGRRFLETHAVPMMDNGKVVHLAVTRDISERKRYENQLREAKVAAEAATVAKSRFLATMSHEIRTPMNGMLGMAQLLLNADLKNSERLDYARTILTSGQTLLALLNDILDLSRVESGRLELETTAVSPAQLVHEMQALFAETAQRKGLHLEARWLGTAEQRYLGDPHRLRQMLSNLVGNAIKFTESGTIRIEVSESPAGDNTANLEFSVSDTGIGIPTDKLKLLFQPFSQADSSTTRQFGGTGLGLSIVSSLAKLMNGEVGVDSEDGQGSRFWFRVTLKRLAAGTDSRRTERPAPLLSNKLAGRVLVVEDSTTNRKVIEALLKQFGLSVIAVNDGQQAVDCICQGEAVDLILMDVHMPVMDGHSATARIRDWEAANQHPRLPIIALTADAFEEDRQRCLAVGMDDVLTKPISADAVKKVLGHYLQAQATSQPEAASAALSTDEQARVSALFDEILPLLAHNKFNAVALFRDLQDAVAGTAWAEKVAAAAQPLAEFRFNAALEVLQRIAKELDEGEVK